MGSQEALHAVFMTVLMLGCCPGDESIIKLNWALILQTT